MKAKSNSRSLRKPSLKRRKLTITHPNAAGIDVGSASHFIAVPADRCDESVREFSSFTSDLYRIADWLAECGVDTVVMESTGVYWIPLYELLDSRGFEVKLVDARRVKNVPGRKSDVLDCQWLQELHTYGLLEGAFRPEDQIVVLRCFLRQRAMLVRSAASHIQHMQKALSQMNLQLHNVISDITGVTGLKIIRAIIGGQRDPKRLASMRDPKCKNSVETIAKSLQGNYRKEHLFSLKQALELYDFYHDKISECDGELERHLQCMHKAALTTDKLLPKARCARRLDRNQIRFDARKYLFEMTGVDLTQIDGIDTSTALVVISEIGCDMTKWPTGKHFGSWMCLSPGSKISGGKVLSTKTKPGANRAANALRQAAQSLHHSQSALGAYFRRMRARLGAPKAITATAYKLARMIYSMLKYGTEYVDLGQQAYEEQYRDRALRNLQRNARRFGYELVKADSNAVCPTS
jgi:transposase